MILAAGEGSRLIPVTSFIPKPLLPLGGKPLFVRIVEKLDQEGYRPIVACVNTNFLDQFEYHVEMTKYQPKVHFSHDRGPLGTAGELLHARATLNKEFLLYYGDIWTDFPLRKLRETWTRYDNPLAVLGVSRRLKIEKGIPEIDGESRITGIREKPEVTVPNLSGFGVFDRRILDYAVSGEDLNAVVLPRAIQKGEEVYAHVFDEGYLDIGSLHSYRTANEYFSKSK